MARRSTCSLSAVFPLSPFAERPSDSRIRLDAIVRPATRRLSRFVQLSTEQARQAVRQDVCFAKKQQSPPALLVVVGAGVCHRAASLPLAGRSRSAPHVGNRPSLTGGSPLRWPVCAWTEISGVFLRRWSLGTPAVLPGPIDPRFQVSGKENSKGHDPVSGLQCLRRRVASGTTSQPHAVEIRHASPAS